MLRDERRLRRRVDKLQKTRDEAARQALAEQLSADLDAAQQRVERRRAVVPEITYPDELPVSQRKDELLAAIRDHQVVVVAGETGSGKTTQLPKICLELGRGVRGAIGHTQPRRLAARTVAERIAEELGVEVGGAVGWKVRFTDSASDDTLVKLMTDGILLAELQNDRMLRQYDTIIVDEAHERSLNIDFILGYLKQLLPRRPDLKVIITSATIDPQRFARHFDDAPVVEVSGRTYPVEVRYRPLEDADADRTQGICDAVDELYTETSRGDILAFLSGEREIRDTADELRKHLERHRLPIEVLPLYARLAAAEQHKVFQRHTGRRIVLATNVAETSLTVPGIEYVIDPGSARISRYSQRTKVQRLPIEPISQASANQRKGRCGRVADGICIRLYAEEDFVGRPEFTDPEILRTSLASVILQMHAAGLGEITDFPFLDPPDRRSVTAGMQLLEELGALDPKVTEPGKRLTAVGRKLAQLPVDPRLARMVVAADHYGCVREVLVVAAALAIQDPRERPSGSEQAADEKHRRFADEGSDFAGLLTLWQYLKDKQRELSSNQFRRMCRNEYLNYLRVREWQDVEGQLRQIAKGLGIHARGRPASGETIHQALLAGLLSHVGMRDPDKRDYAGARGTRFAIFPGSGLFKKSPQWVMAAELVETSRLWARTVARIEPEWVESLAGHLVKREYSEPHWEKKRAAVVAYERVTLYGLPVVAGRKVNYAQHDPELCRELFIRHALVEGDWDTHHEFFHENRALLDEVEDLERRARRRGIVVDDETLFEFYDQGVGAEAVSGRHFDSWWKKTRRTQPHLLTFDKTDLVSDAADRVSDDAYPETWAHADAELPLSYEFDPGTAVDGVTVRLPLATLNQVSADEFAWHVPGLREELVTALIKTLPKSLRRHFVPAPDHAQAALARLDPGGGPLLDALGRELERTTGVWVPPDAWRPDQLPGHLRMTFQVVDADGAVLATGKDLAAVKEEVRPRLQQTLSAVAAGLERNGVRTWDVGTLPRTEQRDHGGYQVKAYPALVDEGDSVAVRLLESEAEQRREMWRGIRRLLLLELPAPIKVVDKQLSTPAKLALSNNPHGGISALLADCADCAVDALMRDGGAPVWDEAGYARLRDVVRAGYADALGDVVRQVERILATAHQAQAALAGMTGSAVAAARDDMRAQYAGLVHPGFVAGTGRSRLPDVLRYLRGIQRRIERLPDNPARDADRQQAVAIVTEAYQEARDRAPADGSHDEALTEVRWMLEELRISHFAQVLGTAYPISENRIYRVLDRLTA
ncbi:MAG: ATP-dependent RNA helicase HrpA [Streptosporangiales bacterium]|nr:ATP-dependent RNA helicase HrpA [Streptosporangiales bacterium]